MLQMAKLIQVYNSVDYMVQGKIGGLFEDPDTPLNFIPVGTYL